MKKGRCNNLAKSRIHELAKELAVDNKKILDYLQSKGIEGKNHMSTLDEDVESMVRKAFRPKTAGNTAEVQQSGTAAADSAKKDSAPVTEEGAAGQPKTEPVKKKKKIMAVFRPQNATSKEGKNFHRQGSTQQGTRTDRRDSGSSRVQKSGSAAKDAPKAPHTPLVKVPRPQPMFRNTEPPQPRKPVQKRSAQPAAQSP